jgi:hypothetical protein
MDILIDVNLPQNPKTTRLMRALRVSRREAVGTLAMLWAHARRYFPDGTLRFENALELAEVIDWKGDPTKLTKALRDTGWLDVDEDGVTKIHDWQEHAGKLVREQIADRERKRAARLALSAGSPPDVRRNSAAVRRNSDPSVAVPVAVAVTVPSLPPTPPGSPTTGPTDDKEDPDPPFDGFWQSYPRKEGKGAARKAWSKIKAPAALLPKILAAVEKAKTCRQWQEDGGRFIPHPATWLNQERWDDSIDETPRTVRGVSVDAHKFDAIDSKPGIQVG